MVRRVVMATLVAGTVLAQVPVGADADRAQDPFTTAVKAPQLARLVVYAEVAKL